MNALNLLAAVLRANGATELLGMRVSVNETTSRVKYTIIIKEI